MAKPSVGKTKKKAVEISRRVSSDELTVTGDSLDVMELMDKADQDFYAGNYRKALLKYEKVLKIEPSLQRAQDNSQKSRYYLETGNIPDEDLPKDIKNTFRHAQSAARAADYDIAIKLILDAIKQSQSAGIQKWVRGELFLQQIEKAIASKLLPFNRFLSDDNHLLSLDSIKSEIKWREGIWQILGWGDDLNQFKKDIEELETIAKELSNIRSDLGHFFETKNYSSAIRDFEAKLNRFREQYPHIQAIHGIHGQLTDIRNISNDYDQTITQIRLSLETFNFQKTIELLNSLEKIIHGLTEKFIILRQESKTRLELQSDYYDLMKEGKHYLDAEEFQLAMDIFSRANLLANTSLPQEPNDLIKNTTHIIPDADLGDALNLFEEAKILFDELEGLKSQLSFAQVLITQEGSCTAFDELIKLTKETPRGKRAAAVVDEAKVLQKNAMLLCADKIFKQGGYQKAKEILQPYANEDDRFPPEIAKISERQNREMKEKEQQKKDLMDDIKKDDRRWSALGLAASILGGVLLMAGVIGAFIGQTSAGIISSMSAILPGLVVALYYNRSDKIRSDRLKLIEKSAGEEQLDLEVVRKAVGLSEAKNGNQSAGEKE